MKILHLSNGGINSLFISQAYAAFECAAPNANDVWVFASPPVPDGDRNAAFSYYPFHEAANGEMAARLSAYDLVVVHSLFENIFPLLRGAKGPQLVWIGYGYDYYDLMKEKIALKKTKNAPQQRSHFIRHHAGRIYRALRQNPFAKQRVVRKIDFFAPVLREEYIKLKARHPDIPEYISWNYGSLERGLIPNEALYTGKNTGSRDILLGNSATPSNNHIEAIDLLARTAPGDSKIITPLSYGDPVYAQYVTNYGRSKLGDRFVPLNNFMPLEDYLRIVATCGTAFMNHIRQQGMGNIVTMLCLGTKIYLREENPVFPHLSQAGVTLFSINALESGARNLETADLPDGIQKKNREAVLQQYGGDAIYQKTCNLIRTIQEKIERQSA